MIAYLLFTSSSYVSTVICFIIRLTTAILVQLSNAHNRVKAWQVNAFPDYNATSCWANLSNLETPPAGSRKLFDEGNQDSKICLSFRKRRPFKRRRHAFVFQFRRETKSRLGGSEALPAACNISITSLYPWQGC